MNYVNRSPGTFIVFANLVVYGVICVEIWMWTAATTAVVAATLALIAICAALICRSVLVLMDDDEADDIAGVQAAAAPAPAPAAAAPAAPRPVRAPAARPARPAVAATKPARSRPMAGHTA
jgi:hypothetical protein